MKNLNIKNELNIDLIKSSTSESAVQLNPNWVTDFMDEEGSFIIEYCLVQDLLIQKSP